MYSVNFCTVLLNLCLFVTKTEIKISSKPSTLIETINMASETLIEVVKFSRKKKGETIYVVESRSNGDKIRYNRLDYMYRYSSSFIRYPILLFFLYLSVNELFFPFCSTQMNFMQQKGIIDFEKEKKN